MTATNKLRVIKQSLLLASEEAVKLGFSSDSILMANLYEAVAEIEVMLPKTNKD
jgi:hypothetical protein